ncbi:myb-like protein X [Vespa crabro]|uniref:myb-like protein X n=1 Tax=Vespa crabro TaxID=7445 RepID=UPI001F01B9E6|nr:myb-like protein X [Vespa crabro]
MSEYCFLCLTDEGVFLDITPTNYKTLRGDVETFLSLKVNKKISNKVCYKCAFELRQCSDFLKKYKDARKTVGTSIYKRKCCTFCLESGKRRYIFHLNRCLHPLNNLNDDLISKVQQLFQDELIEYSQGIILMCLTCRYSLDILFDLRSLYLEFSKERDTFSKNIDYSILPKVNTIVIKRKTTITASMKTRSYILSNSESDNPEVTMNKDISSLQPKPRFCGACKNSVKDGEDMYRFYKTRLTVCKTCWTSMDPSKCKTRLKKPTRSDTKLCAVFLKDVLTDVTFKEHKGYKVEKDSYGNNIYVITDSESEVDVEDKIDTESLQPQEKISKESDNKPKIGQKRSKMHTKSDSSDSETKSIKRMKSDKETTSKISKLQNTNRMKRSAGRNHYSDTDILLKKGLRANLRTRGIKQENKNVYSLSDMDTNKSQRKKRNTTLGNLKSLREDNTSDDSSLTGDSINVKNSNEQQSINISETHSSNNITGKRKKKSNSSSTSASESTSTSKAKSFPLKRLRKTSISKSKISIEETSSDNTETDELDSNRKEKYICRECGITLENKLKLATHELTHFKTLELKLHKLRIQDKCKDDEKVDELNVDKFNDELNEQQNEEITLSVIDDEESETTDVPNQIDVIQDTTEKSDKDIKESHRENEEKDSLEMHITDKEVREESELIETITETISKDPIEVNKDKDKKSESTEQNESIVTTVENNNTSKDIDNDQDQNDDSNDDKTKDTERSIKEMEVEVNEETVNKDKMKINESVEDEDNENIEEPEDNTKNKEEDKIEEVKEDDNVKEKEDTTTEKENEVKDKEDNTMEMENNKNEKENGPNEIENNMDETKDITKEMKDITMETKDMTMETKDMTMETKDVTMETKDVTMETKDVTMETKDVTMETKDVTMESKDMTMETKDVTMETNDITMEIEDETNKRDDATNETEDDETNKRDDNTMEKKVDETDERECKIKEIEMSNAEKEGQNSDINNSNKDLNSNNSILNVNINLADDTIENLNIENEKSTDNKDEKNETDNGIINDTSLESCNTILESNIPISDTNSIKDNSKSVQETDKELDISNIKKSEEEKECTNDTQKLLNDLTTMNEPTTCKEVSSINQNNKESVNAVVEMEEHVFDLVTNKQQNHLSTVEHNVSCSQMEPETLEDITREIQKSADMPSLDPINSMEMDHNSVSIN